MNGHAVLATSFGGLAQANDHDDDLQEIHVYALYDVSCYDDLAGGVDGVCCYHP